MTATPAAPEFLFLGGRISLDLTCTYRADRGVGEERLNNPGDLCRWIVQAGLTTGRFVVADSDLDTALRLRTAIDRAAAAVMADDVIGARDGRTLTTVAAASPLSPRLTPDGSALTWTAQHKPSASLSTVARDALDLFTGSWRRRVRVCEDSNCGVLFVDTSRPGSRRWCSSEICGGRTRARTYRVRHAASR